MAFFKFLKGIGDKLGILETAPGPESAPVSRIQTRIVSLQDLEGEIRSGEIRALADSPAELTIPVEKIFEAAGISSKPEDWTVVRLKQVVERESARKEPRESVQRAVLEMLNSKGVSPEVIVKDAIARDQALDSFESRVTEKMEERLQSCRKRLQAIEQSIRELKDESAGLESRMRVESEQWKEWRRAKRAHERELASLVSYLVDRSVITADEDHN